MRYDATTTRDGTTTLPPSYDANAADAVDRMLLDFLAAQRASALEIIAGLSREQLTTPVLPSGWTPLGMIEHLGHAERHWFQGVAQGCIAPLPWAADTDHTVGFTSDHPTEAVVAFYRDEIARADALLASTPLSTRPVGRHNQGESDQVADLRFIVLHMIEETARHLGHLDAARELIDGRVELGQDDL